MSLSQESTGNAINVLTLSHPPPPPRPLFIMTQGVLVESLRKGYWIILDELNLAPSEVRNKAAVLLEGKMKTNRMNVTAWFVTCTKLSAPLHTQAILTDDIHPAILVLIATFTF